MIVHRQSGKAGRFAGISIVAAALVACGPQKGTPDPAGPAVAPTTAPTMAPVATPANTTQPSAQSVTNGPAPVAPARPLQPHSGAAPQVMAANLGEVRSIDPVRNRPQGNGTGAVVGGVLGAVVGNQFGGGNGRAATTVLGAVGGAVAGNNVERNHREEIVGYRVNVHLDNGESRTFQETTLDGLRVGDRVRVESGQLHRV